MAIWDYSMGISEFPRLRFNTSISGTKFIKTSLYDKDTKEVLDCEKVDNWNDADRFMDQVKEIL